MPIRVIITVNNSNNSISSSKEYVPKSKMLFLNASTEYVAGSTRVMIFNQGGRLSIGNNAPLRKKSGKTTKLTIN